MHQTAFVGRAPTDPLDEHIATHQNP